MSSEIISNKFNTIKPDLDNRPDIPRVSFFDNLTQSIIEVATNQIERGIYVSPEISIALSVINTSSKQFCEFFNKPGIIRSIEFHELIYQYEKIIEATINFGSTRIVGCENPSSESTLFLHPTVLPEKANIVSTILKSICSLGFNRYSFLKTIYEKSEHELDSISKHDTEIYRSLSLPEDSILLCPYQNTSLHFSDPNWFFEHFPQDRFLPGSDSNKIAREILEDNTTAQVLPATNFFWDLTLSELKEIPDGGFFTKDSIQSLRKRNLKSRHISSSKI